MNELLKGMDELDHIFMLRADVFHGIFLASQPIAIGSCTAYHWAAFTEAE